jgi:hypothetical protein
MTKGTYDMMPQKEVSEAIHQQRGSGFGGYEGNQTASAHQHAETSYEQELKEGPYGKVSPLSRDKTNIVRFALPLIALGLLVLFGVLFVVVVGGMAGAISFAAACLVICCILAYVATMPRQH